MHWTSALTGACLVGTLLAPHPRAVTPAQAGVHFPQPSEGITIGATLADGGPSMADVLRDFARVAGQNLSISAATRKSLEKTPAGLIDSVDVRARDRLGAAGRHLVMVGDRSLQVVDATALVATPGAAASE